MIRLTPEQRACVKSSRVAHLATVDGDGLPHVLPVCFVHQKGSFYSPLDQKPKRVVNVLNLRRVRNIQGNPDVTLVLDYYDEEWSKLWYIQIRGTARIISESEEHKKAICSLTAKYPQYLEMKIEDYPIIKIIPFKIVCWGNFNPRMIKEN